MKVRLTALFLLLVSMTLALLLSGCSNDSSRLVGKWIDVKTEATYEYTADGFYYEYVNEGFTTDKTRYRVRGGKITYYVDGNTPESGFSVEYEINDEGHLIIGGQIEYRPLIVPEKEEEN